MTIRHQPQSEKYPYASPTTPGLYVTFRAYIIELICLNVDKRIGPRFWSDKKYWGPKFRREVKGVDNVFKQLETMNTLIQTAFIQIVKEHNIKSLLNKITVKRVVNNIRQRETELEQQRANLRIRSPRREVDDNKNSTFVDVGTEGVLAKIRKTEDGQKKNRD